MKAVAELLLGIGVYLFLAACLVFGAATIWILTQRLWAGSCIA